MLKFAKRTKKKKRVFPEISENHIQAYFETPDENLNRYQNSVFPIYSHAFGFEDARIHLNKNSHNPAFYLVHGLGATIHFFFEGTLFLKEHGFEVFTHSKRGEISDKDDLTGLDVEMLVDDMEKQIDRVGLQEAHIIASSFGGILSLRLAERRPDFAQSITLIGSFLNFNWGLEHEVGFDVLKRVNPNKLPATDLGPFLPQMQFIRERSTKVMQYVLKEYETLPVNKLFEYVSYLKKMDYTQNPPKIHCPLLILHGEQDNVVTMKAYKTLKETYREATAILLPNCGHGPFLSKPATLYTEILRHATQSVLA
ncbi:MAG: alpha/beta hydrolase [Candidatus Hydrogenedentota bacterium]|nr:MAG: alpha/beta hydrolase [Candidatus Hydrogenedentota bacterium]